MTDIRKKSTDFGVTQLLYISDRVTQGYHDVSFCKTWRGAAPRLGRLPRRFPCPAAAARPARRRRGCRHSERRQIEARGLSLRLPRCQGLLPTRHTGRHGSPMRSAAGETRCTETNIHRLRAPAEHRTGLEK